MNNPTGCVSKRPVARLRELYPRRITTIGATEDNLRLYLQSPRFVRRAKHVRKAEYNALSFAMRSVLPFQNTVQAVARAVGQADDRPTLFKTTVWVEMLAPWHLRIWNPEDLRLVPNTTRSNALVSLTSTQESNLSCCQSIQMSNERTYLTLRRDYELLIREIRKLLCGW